MTLPQSLSTPWFKDTSLWLRAIVTLVALIVLGSVAFGASYSVDGNEMYLRALIPSGWVGLCVIFLGTMWQHFRPEQGLLIVACGLFLFGASTLFVFPLGYVFVCYEAYFISSQLRVRRVLWLVLLLSGSFGALVWFVVCNAFFIDSTGVGLDVQRQQARDLFVEPEFWAAVVVTSLLVVVSIALMWLWGRVALRRNQELEMLAARAELATVSERNRITREMHDIIAHSLTGIIAQADGGRYAGKKDPELAIQALNTIAASGRDALKQMRGLLSVLHEDMPRDRGAVPGVAALPGLISDAQRNGLTVDFDVVGDERVLDEARGLTIYRVVQESLTNVLKHAGEVETQVRVIWRKDDVMIRVDNAQGEDNVEGSGHGLAGIRERVLIYGGRATWGESAVYPGGWNVTAIVPVEGS